ncbi:MAG: DUF4968 domain-containing protein [Calditrichaceae bacterium]|nr:DUF4968 domain-containing protein [Calditrichaceae bacterium]MBN2708256.1 DUF4968 domain-containing protein [Calditrichaceae bacterium]RQV92277.1 MAG: DUF4968 domain-containing protein [Calditrichota bacterium]
MKSIHFITLVSLIIFSSYHSNYAYEKIKDGILLKPKAGKNNINLIKIQVCAENIFRIVAAPGDSFSTRPSLMRDWQNQEQTDFTINNLTDEVEITTSKVVVSVNKKTGEVQFKDKNGQIILSERAGGGKFIMPANVLGEETYHVQQLFNSPHDEAFFGLGAHQNAVWNYKGQDVDLWQYNIVDIIPFLISNKNYGILWDNNSRTKFGDIRDYQSLNATVNLYDVDGKVEGLTAEYFKDVNFTDLYIARNESKIEHEFIDVNDKFPEGFEQNVKAVRWSGEIRSQKTGLYKFRLYCSGYTKMWLNDKLVVDSWRQNWLPWTHYQRLNMEAGKKYKIKIEWIHTGGYIGLKALSPEDEIYQNNLSLYSEVADQIDYYFIYGENIDEIIMGYRIITGKAPMMPKWAMGLWQCRERYKTQDELLSVVREFRKRQIPLDNIVQDWFYWPEDQWGSHEFDESSYPNPDRMVSELHEKLNTHIMISVWPKFYIGTKHFNEFKKNGWLYMRNVERGQKDWVGPGYVSTFYDPYSAEARNLYWKQINEKLYSKGFDAWWLDSTEPDLQSNLSLEETRLRIGPTALGSASRYLNTYSLMNAKGVYENQRKTNPDNRVFILTRSAFAGQQRYSTATWSGDIASRWYDLKAQIPAGLNFCLSGIPYWTTDIGGFAVEQRYEKLNNEADLDEWRELNTRWFQFGAFCPLFRVHGQYPYREMFNIAPENHPAYQSMLKYDKLRYRLMPYIYSLTGMVTHQNYTIMRALIMDFGNDKNVINIGDQFMFGPYLLINPVTEYKARKRMIYLSAETEWYDLHSEKYYSGGQTIEADAPYTEIPVFIKAGAIIPCGPEIQYTSQKKADPIRLFIYEGNNGQFTLYEDESNNYNYERGFFSEIPFKYDDSAKILTIGERIGSFPGMPEKRKFEIKWIRKEKPEKLDFESSPDKIVSYEGREMIIQMN